MDGTKEAVLYSLAHQDEYDEIIFDPVRGVEGPFIVSIPHMYVLFYSKYDPATYQKEIKERADKSFVLGKYTIRPIHWPTDQGMPRRLLIGTQWSLPEKDVPKEWVKKQIFMHNGQLAFYIVSSRGNDID